MVKAIFCDFYGTLVHEFGPISYEIMNRILKSGTAASLEEVMTYWWPAYSKRLANANGDSFRLQEEMIHENFAEVIEQFQSTESAKELTDLMVKHWCNPPIYEDTKAFLENLTLPIYFISNSDDFFIDEALKNLDLHPTSVITSQQTKHYKPNQEIFLQALNRAGLNADETIHIGDSLTGDIESPRSIGINAIWMNRDNKPVPEGILAVSDLTEFEKLLTTI